MANQPVTPGPSNGLRMNIEPEIDTPDAHAFYEASEQEIEQQNFEEWTLHLTRLEPRMTKEEFCEEFPLLDPNIAWERLLLV
jgi:hypothetical protein